MVVEVTKALGVTDVTQYRRRQEYGGGCQYLRPSAARNSRENGAIESFNGILRDGLLNREIFFTLAEAKILITHWREEYNTIRPHSALGYRPPMPQA